MYLLFVKKYYKQLLLIMCVILIIVYLLLNKIYEKFATSVYVENRDNLNCKVAWSAWSPCPTECNITQEQTRTKQITQERGYIDYKLWIIAGLPCDYNSLTGPYTQQCPVIPCPIDCVGKFVKDSECSKSCGGGTYTEKYQITTPAQHNGIECPFEDGAVKEVECNTQICSPIDCSGEYVNKGLCVADNGSDCGPGKQQQEYKILKPLEDGGNPCPVSDNTIRSISCNLKPCPINCVGSFGEYGSCSKTCGGGKKERVYKVTQQDKYDGKECLNKTGDIDISDCNTQPCPIDCVGSFGDYGECNTTCGGGKKERIYTVTQESQYGGAECLNKPDDKEVIDCNTEPCPIDCKGEFLDFAPCSKECGNDGILLQKYNIINEAQYGGKKCPNYQDDLKSIPCNRQPCPTYPVNTVIQEALKESNNQLQNIRYDIINRQETLDLLTNKFNRLNKNISFLQNNSKYIPDDKTLKFY